MSFKITKSSETTRDYNNSDLIVKEPSMKESALVNRTEKSALSVLKLIISEEIVKAKNMDSNVIFEIRKINFSDGKTDQPIRKFYDQFQVIQIENEEEIFLKMPKKCDEAILKFLLNDRPSPTYCCVDFWMDTVGLYSNRTVNHVIGKWKAKELDESLLSSGEPIVIHNKVQEPVHFAVYLTNGIYLSVFGISGWLIATTLDQMKIGFNGVTAYKLKLRRVKKPIKNLV